MISCPDFFLRLNFFYNQKTPFVCFRLPGTNTLKCYSGKEQKINHNAFPKDPGFIMMPFDKSKEGYFISSKTMFETKIPSDSLKNSLTEEFNQQEKFNSHKENYLKKIVDIKNTISKTELIKLVYSTSFELDLIQNNFEAYFKKLLRLHKDAFCYLFYIPNEGYWMGASPETLLEVQDKKITTMALAGTKKRNVVRWGNKEILEQKIVKDEIKKNLTPFCENLETTNSSTIKAGGVDHLKTTISGTTISSPSQIINAIHPTPAVGGAPKEKALLILKKKESHNRSFYSGYLGEINNMNCTLFVNLRCVHIKKNKARIFVGGGITKDSRPEKEWEEIINKSQTILEALFR